MSTSGDDQRRVPGPHPSNPSTTNQPAVCDDERLDDIRPPLTAEAVATAHDAARLRHELSAWLALDVPDEQLDDLVLAAYEAIANAAEHAYADSTDGAGPIHLRAHRYDDCVCVCVVDEGRWRVRTGQRFRSRGLPLIRLLVSDVHIGPSRTGTTVHLRMWLPTGVLA
jgi:anti-sigma regulatory factor (Ser/Thr protein kinase)